MVAENISLGILSLPGVLAKVGMVGGLIAIIGLGLFTTYSGYVLWQFKMKYPQVGHPAGFAHLRPNTDISQDYKLR